MSCSKFVVGFSGAPLPWRCTPPRGGAGHSACPGCYADGFGCARRVPATSPARPAPWGCRARWPGATGSHCPVAGVELASHFAHHHPRDSALAPDGPGQPLELLGVCAATRLAAQSFAFLGRGLLQTGARALGGAHHLVPCGLQQPRMALDCTVESTTTRSNSAGIRFSDLDASQRNYADGQGVSAAKFLQCLERNR